jgi:F-type H+-transporting ATPase subunit b
MELLSLKPGILIWTWVTFFVLLIILRRVAWKPLVKIIEDRENTIAEDIRRTEQSRIEAEKIMTEQKAKLAETHEEVKKIMEENKQIAEKTRKEIVEKAREEANKIIDRGKTDIEREREEALLAIRKEVSSLVVGAASKLIEMQIDEKKHRELIDKSINQLGKN